MQTLDSELLYPDTRPHTGDKTLARELTREEAFSQALLGARMVLSDRLYTGTSWPALELFKDGSEPHMEIIYRFLNPILEEGLTKHAARTKAGLTDRESETLLDSLLRETTGIVASKLYRGCSN